jgi:hypothetical protein
MLIDAKLKAEMTPREATTLTITTTGILTHSIMGLIGTNYLKDTQLKRHAA